MRPPALFVLPSKTFDLVYDVETTRLIAKHVELLDTAARDPAQIGRDDELRVVEVLFSSWGAPKLDEKLLHRMPALRIIFYAAGSIRPVATPAMWERGIRITTATAVNGEAVANYAVGAILFALKQGFGLAREVRAGGGYSESRLPVAGVAPGTVALISFGTIARAVARRLKDFGPRIIVFDPFLGRATAKSLGIEKVSLTEAFARANVVSLHTPLLPETRGLVDGTLLASMRTGATFINTARGAVVNSAELASVLASRPDITALLDVTNPEPPESNSPLLTLPNIIVTPHIAGATGAECRLLGQFMLAELGRWIKGESLHGEVTQAQADRLA